MRERRMPTPFGRAIKVRLAQLNMQQSDLAKLLGLSNAYVTYLIYGDRRDEGWVARICEVLDMQLPQQENLQAALGENSNKGC